MNKYNVLGITETQYVGDRLVGHNGKFVNEPEVMRSHRVYVELNEKTICISLFINYCESSARWCEAAVANVECVEIEPGNILPFTHVPVTPFTMEEVDDSLSEIQNEVFTFSADGGDKNYQSGYYNINWEKFKETPRLKSKRVVYIFTGENGVGKTYLANSLDDLDVMETDVLDKLPDAIYAEVVVLGNRRGFTLDEVKERIFKPAHIVVCRMTFEDLPEDD